MLNLYCLYAANCKKNVAPFPADVMAPTLPEAQSLHTLFNLRSVCTITDPDDDRLTATFWQTTFEADEPDMVGDFILHNTGCKKCFFS